ncbi:MAG: DUF5615 family PIN-like protein [Saprospiraceae bacterium]|nr:DUF5615 family PIN-like protein [Saprospiraceae bacterium]
MLLFDNNISPEAPVQLVELFEGCKHVLEVNLGSADDVEVWNYAKENNLAIISKDKDFYI